MGLIEKYNMKRITHWTLAVLVVLYLISGWGITRYRIVEPLTFNLLTKARAFMLHSWITYPFIILLVLHIYFTLAVRFKKKE